MTGFDVAVLGSGFAGSILARCLNARGMRVLLIERGSHPRFALGESSTPLANLCLERLAERYDLEDLYDQAAWGRWQKNLSREGGLKRGFTFFDHVRGDRDAPRSENSLWVAASPDDRLADSQWLRSSVDASLASRAVSEGVRLIENAQVSACIRRDAVWQLDLEQDRVRPRSANPRSASSESAKPGPGQPSQLSSLEGQLGREPGAGKIQIEADFLVDATGAARFASRHLDAGNAATPIRTSLLSGHFRGVPEPPSPTEAPYESAWSAVHHLLEDGWVYELRFQDGLVSAGVLTAGTEGDKPSGDSVSTSVHGELSAYPWLAERYRHALPRGSVTRREGVAYRAERASGDGWVVLPHGFAFVDPLFSTGIAWSLLGVERVASVLSGAARNFSRYGSLLESETVHIGRLVQSAYRNLGDFERFCTIARGYFVAASFMETCQRLLLPEEASWPSGNREQGWEWAAFLGADDLPLAKQFRQFAEAGAQGDRLRSALKEAVAARDVAGFGTARNSYAVDLQPLRQRAALLGLSAEALELRLPRLFSPDTLSELRTRTAEFS